MTGIDRLGLFANFFNFIRSHRFWLVLKFIYVVKTNCSITLLCSFYHLSCASQRLLEVLFGFYSGRLMTRCTYIRPLFLFVRDEKISHRSKGCVTMSLPHQITFLQYFPPEYFSTSDTRCELSRFSCYLLSASELSPRNAPQVSLFPPSDRILTVPLP